MAQNNRAFEDAAVESEITMAIGWGSEREREIDRCVGDMGGIGRLAGGIAQSVAA